ncbi:hypothetical protein ABW21_db0203695 [Orbilia brochopaga]|nr:hypothetical protein ABW21_db0203695 [Drechslerella brochopaga]
MITYLIALFLVFINFGFVYSQNAGPFINPPEANGAPPDPKNNPVYTVGNSLNITWTLAGTVSLVIWQTKPNGSDIGGLQYLPASHSVANGYYTWNPIGVNGDNNQPRFDLVESNIFHFDLYKDGATGASALSTSFNLTNDTVDAHGSVISVAASSSISLSRPISTSKSTKTLLAPSSTSSTTTSIDLLSTSSTSPISTPTTSSSPSASQTSTGLSTGIKAGIAIAVSIGTLGVIFGLWQWYRNKRSPKIEGEHSVQVGGIEYLPGVGKN